MADMPINDKLFYIQSNVIKRVAQEGSCVIVGRCADYILRNNPNCVNVFIHACMNKKLERAVNEYKLAADSALDEILRMDKSRASYYNYYSDRKWGRAENYHLCIDSGVVGVDNAVDLIISFVEMKRKVC